MPWNGSAPNKTFGRSDGTRTGTQVWQQAEADDVDIVSTDHDTHDQDLASGINSALLKDGGNTATANLPMGGFKHTNVADATAKTQYATLGQSIVNGGIYVATVAGTANAITLTTGLSLTTLAAGSEFSFIVSANNTDATTVTVDSVTAIDLVRLEGDPLQAGDLYQGAVALIKYDGTNFQLLNRRIDDSGTGGGGSMTGTEIVEAINVSLGSEDWQEIGTTELIPESLTDGRVRTTATVNGFGGAKFNACATYDGRLLVWGDNAAFAFNPAGDTYRPYQIPVPWDTSTVTIEAIYMGQNYILVQTDESTQNLYHLGGSDSGQGGMGSTSSTTSLTRITAFSAVKIRNVWTEGTRNDTNKFWFALTTTGRVYSCGYSGAQHVMGYNSTTNLSTPRLMTLSDGTTPLSNVSSITCDSIYSPVWALLTTGGAYRWGAGTNGAHGNNSTTALTWPTVLETVFGSGVARTDISAIATSGGITSLASTQAVTWLLTTAGKIEAAGYQQYGIGDGAALAATNRVTFTAAVGTISTLTTSSIRSGGGATPVCVAITSTGTAYGVGRFTGGLLGNGSTSDISTFTALANLPSGFSGALTDCKIAGAFTNQEQLAIFLEATISGTKRLASIGYDTYYATAKNTTGVAAASQTWGLVSGTWGTISSWYVFGSVQEYGLCVLNTDGELRYAGANDQGQSGCDFEPSVVTKVPTLQIVVVTIPRVLKPPIHRGAYGAGTTYYKQDVVTRSGSSWIYNNDVASAGNTPPTLPTESNSYWQLFAQKGDAGFANVVFDFDGGTSTLTSGMKARVPVSFDATITQVTLISDTTGSIVIDVWKDTYANYPPTVADTITASAKPTLSSAQKYQDSTLTGWTTTVTAGDILIANIDSVSGITNAVLTLKMQRT